MPLNDGTTTLEPLLWLTSESARRSQNVIHPLMSGRIAGTLGGVSPRQGRLGLLFASGEEADACVRMHADGDVFEITEPGRPYLNMTYILDEGGAVDAELLTDPDPDADLWMVRIDFQEVTE